MQDYEMPVLSKYMPELTPEGKKAIVEEFKRYRKDFGYIIYILLTTTPIEHSEAIKKFLADKPIMQEQMKLWGNDVVNIMEKYILKITREKRIEIPNNFDEFYYSKHGEPSMLIRCADLCQEELEKEEAAKRMKEDIRRKRPDNYVMPNNKLANALPLLVRETAEQNSKRKGFDLIVAHKGTPKEITSRTIIDLGQDDGILFPSSYTAFDREVQNGICTLYLSGCDSFTSAMVYRAMTASDCTPRSQTIAAVTRSIEKQRRIKVMVDASDELKKRKLIGSNDIFKIGDFLISARDIEARIGGQDIVGYFIKEKPMLLAYSEKVGQLSTVNRVVFEIRKVTTNGTPTARIPDSVERIEIKGTLARRIEAIKNKKNKIGNRILFASILESAGQECDTWNKKKRHFLYIIDCLMYWKSIGYIKDYILDSKNKLASAADIIISPPAIAQN